MPEHLPDEEQHNRADHRDHKVDEHALNAAAGRNPGANPTKPATTPPIVAPIKPRITSIIKGESLCPIN